MLHQRVARGGARLVAFAAPVLSACGFGLVLPACGTGNGSEQPPDPADVEVAAVNSRAAGGLALGTGDASPVVVAAAAGTPAGDIDLFTGFADAATLDRVQRLAPRPEAIGIFGAAIAFSGMSVAISATHEDPSGNAFGYVDLFEPAGAGWVHRETVAAPCVSPASNTGSSELGFGRAIDLTPQDLVVGAGRYAGGYGRAFVFHRDGADGRFRLTADLQEPADVQRFDAYFGDTVQIDGDTLIVTRPDTSAFTGDGPKSGKVYVYRRVRPGEGTWALEQMLQSPHADGSWDGFGTAAALAGDLLAVRSRDETWVFQRKSGVASSAAPANGEGATNANGDGWQPVWRTAVGRGERGSVALGPDFLVIGDPTTAVEENEAAGAVRVFERVRPDAGGAPEFTAVRTWTEPYPGANHGFGARVTIRGGRLLVGVSVAAASAAVMPGAYVRDLPQPGESQR